MARALQADDVDGLLAEAQTVLGPGASLPSFVPAHVDPREILPGVTVAALEALEAGGTDDRERRRLLDLALRASDLMAEFQRRASERQLRLQARVREGLARLREVPNSAELLDLVCDEAVRSCGMRRVVLSRVDGSTWYPWNAHFDGDSDAEVAFVTHIRGITIDLDEAPIERDVLDERRPRIVRDATGATRYGPMIDVSGSTSYVVAPITPAGRVVGFLHGDHHPERTAVDSIDRDVLWTFAEGFGRIYERTELLERLRAQRATLHETFELVETITVALDQSEIQLGAELDGQQGDGPVALPEEGMQPAIAEQLTDREREVLALMVRGLGNAAIAERLVIKEGTVKSHVKHILRKLGAANRAELIALSMGAITN